MKKKYKDKEKENAEVTKVYDPVYVTYLSLAKRLEEFGVKKKSIFISIRCSERLGMRYYCSFWAYSCNFKLTCGNLPNLCDDIYKCMDKWFPISENNERKMDKQYFPNEE